MGLVRSFFRGFRFPVSGFRWDATGDKVSFRVESYRNSPEAGIWNLESGRMQLATSFFSGFQILVSGFR
jgi:hypothetical protein